MGYSFVRDDITKVKADAIVNSANPNPICGGGMDYAVYKAAGMEKLLKAREQVGQIARGQAFETPAFGLKCNNVKYIIHTVGPLWEGGNNNELQILRDCYDNSLRIAARHKCKSIAFPLISTGVYGFPKDKALNVALASIHEFLMQHDMKIILVVFDESSLKISGKLVDEIREYVDKNYVADSWEKAQEYYQLRKQQDPNFAFEEGLDRRRRMRARFESLNYDLKESVCYSISEPSAHKPIKQQKKFSSSKLSSNSVKEINGIAVGPLEETFQEMVLKIMEKKNLIPTEVYDTYYITKQVFSKMLGNKNYKPRKGTAVSFCLSLKLNIDETNDLLGRAGYVLSSSNVEDMVVRACINKKVFDKSDVDYHLMDFQCPILKDMK